MSAAICLIRASQDRPETPQGAGRYEFDANLIL